MAQDQPVFAVRSADQLGVTQTDYYRFEKYSPTAAKAAQGDEYSHGRSLPVWRRLWRK